MRILTSVSVILSLSLSLAPVLAQEELKASQGVLLQGTVTHSDAGAGHASHAVPHVVPRAPRVVRQASVARINPQPAPKAVVKAPPTVAKVSAPVLLPQPAFAPPMDARADKNNNPLMHALASAQKELKRTPNNIRKAMAAGKDYQSDMMHAVRDMLPKSPVKKPEEVAGIPAQPTASHWTPANLQAPYVWWQSAQGGYYDGTGHHQGLVWGNRLKEFGGRFSEGTPVPIEPVTVNSMGHVWYQAKLSATGFRNKKDFPRQGVGL